MKKKDSSFEETGQLYAQNRYDLIVIGGGIQGATIAWESVSRGLSTLLLEQNDFGSGVSANSLKIIHGGIRYLQKLDIARMRQSIRERRTFLRIAPHLVRPMRCVIPAYGNLGKGRLALGVGTKLYDLIAIDRNRGLDPTRRIRGSQILSAEEFKTLIPQLVHTDISGGACWWDAQVFNSERLVLAFVISAKNRGADVFNYAKVEKIIQKNGRVCGIVAKDLLTGAKREIQCDVVMDCTGPWLDSKSAGIDRTYARAMNLVIRQPLADYAFGIRSIKNKSRMLFFVPWRDGSIVGTWYNHKDVTDGPGSLTISQHDIENALDEVNSVFSQPSFRLEDITAVHLGLLPAFRDTIGSGEPVICDRFLIADSDGQGASGLFRIQGVKYTTARDVAHKALKAATRYLKVKPKRSMTRLLPLYGGDIKDFEKFQNDCLELYSPDFPSSLVKRLIDNYGSNIHLIFDYVDSSSKLGELVPGTEDVLQAELAYVLDHEMTRTLPDLIFRRTDLGTFAMPAEKTIKFCADFMAERLEWDDQTRHYNIKMLSSQFPRWIQEI